MHYEISRQLAHSTIIRVVTKFRIEFGKSMRNALHVIVNTSIRLSWRAWIEKLIVIAKREREKEKIPIAYSCAPTPRFIRCVKRGWMGRVGKDELWRNGVGDGVILFTSLIIRDSILDARRNRSRRAASLLHYYSNRSYITSTRVVSFLCRVMRRGANIPIV